MSSEKNANLDLHKWAAKGGVYRVELNDKFEKNCGERRKGYLALTTQTPVVDALRVRTILRQLTNSERIL